MKKQKPPKPAKGFRPTALEIEQIRAERAAAKLIAAQKPFEQTGPHLHPRAMLPLKRTTAPTPALKFTVMSYNMLAQCLVRKELYPFAASLYLRQKYRFDRILRELSERSPTLLAMQEVDNYENPVGPALNSSSYDAVYALKAKVNNSRPGEDESKTAPASTEDAGGHGLLLAWKRDLWSREAYKELKFDGHPLTHPTPVRPKTGNIAQMVALRSTSKKDFGLILGNVHAFWRPAAKYERARQIYVLVKELLSFRDSVSDGKTEWTTLLCGDFNSVPSSAAYRVLTRKEDFSDPETRRAALEELEPHISAFGALGVDEPADSETGPYPTNPFPPSVVLEALERLPVTLESAYGNYTDVDERHRTGDPRWEAGMGWMGEPAYTTSCLFAGTLDYIFLLRDRDEKDEKVKKDEAKYRVEAEKVLEVPPVEVVLPGIPNEVFPSDHVSLMAEYAVTAV
jgi:mRNA deadenylase 3'-5' endonuclease subunit Ccr4